MTTSSRVYGGCRDGGAFSLRSRVTGRPVPNQAASGNGAVASRFHSSAPRRAVPALRRWTRMRTLISLSALCLMLLGCATTPQDVQVVWAERTPPPPDLPPPAGFTVSPLQAYSTVSDSRALTLKHVWHLYADSRYYYVHDTFLGDSPRRAFAQGVRLDGRSGEIVKR